MIVNLSTWHGNVLGLLLLALSPALAAAELASIETHSQRYGSHLAISAYDDPLVKGITCYVSQSRDDAVLGSGRLPRSTDLDASCQQTGDISLSPAVPRQALVFGAAGEPHFDSLHIIRIVDNEHRALVYFTYSEDATAGDMPGHLSVIRLPAGVKPPSR